jgi:hypothetical protein
MLKKSSKHLNTKDYLTKSKSVERLASDDVQSLNHHSLNHSIRLVSLKHTQRINIRRKTYGKA